MARHQHDEYVDRLVTSGLDVISIEPDPNHPDCVFIEDTAVLVGTIAIATLPGARERRGEVRGVADVLASTFELRTIESPGTLDGGDVMVSRGTVFVGRSKRTNQAGISQLSDVAAESGLKTVAVDVTGVLHLKSGVLPVGAETLVITPGTVDEDVFDGHRIVHEDASERNRFSAVPLADRVLVTESAPKTSSTLDRLGFQIDPIDVSEILAADGGLTCMSIIEL